jgi:hypothetical protein
MTDLWRIYGQVFRILIFEFRMTPKTTENQWKNHEYQRKTTETPNKTNEQKH